MQGECIATSIESAQRKSSAKAGQFGFSGFLAMGEQIRINSD